MTVKTLAKRFPAAVCILLIIFVGRVVAQETKLKWFGHAAFSITTAAQQSFVDRIIWRN